MKSQVLVPLIVSMMILGSMSIETAAISYLTESGTELLDGEFNNTRPTLEKTTLSPDDGLEGKWTTLNNGTPAAGDRMALSYDPVKDVVVCYGGINNFNQTWIYSYDTRNWTNMNPSSTPQPLYSHVMVYQPKIKKHVLFGGKSVLTPTLSNDTWTYDLEKNEWTKVTPYPSPSRRAGHNMVYDSRIGNIVLFGGVNDSIEFNDTWVYDAENNTWMDKAPTISPPIRCGHAMAYDVKNDITILQAGGTYQKKTINYLDTWVYNFTDNNWTQMNPSQGPDTESAQSMVYDSYLDQPLIHIGGRSYTYNYSDDSWNSLATNNNPSSRQGFGMAYDTRHNLTILFGGNNNFDLGDLWTLDSSTLNWTGVPQTVGGKWYHGMAIDNAKGLVLVTGGYNQDGTTNTSWIFNLSSNNWTQVRPWPSPRYLSRASLVYDESNGLIVLFGGSVPGSRMNETWTYNASQNAWTELNPALSPTKRNDQAMAYDKKNGVIVLFGGETGSRRANDTWTFNFSQNTWKKMNPSSFPESRMQHQMAYDSANGVVILFGGMDGSRRFKDTWAYDFQTDSWTEMQPEVSPPAQYGHSMAYDTKSSRTVLFSPETSETWTYDYCLNKWIQKLPGYSPFPRRYQTSVYDEKNHRVLLFGGHPESYSYGPFYNDLWAYESNQFQSNGTYTSNQIDTRGSAYFGRLAFNASCPPNTSIGFQLRSADTSTNLTKRDFIGPDGTPDTYYVQSGLKINNAHNRSRWIQYRISLKTKNISDTPAVYCVNISYNLIHDLWIKKPTPGSTFEKTVTFSWGSRDPDNDSLSYDLILINSTGETAIAENYTTANGTYAWNSTSVPNGEYQIKIRSRDNNPTIPLSVESVSSPFRIFNNHLPSVSIIDPSDDYVTNQTNISLHWAGHDEDGDPIRYYVFIDTVAIDVNNNSISPFETDEPSWFVDNLENGTTYYWTVLPFDGKDKGVQSPMRKFTVRIPPINTPPTVSKLSPSNGTTLGNTTVQFRWAGSDLEWDPIEYYFFIDDEPIGYLDLLEKGLKTNLTEKVITNLTNGTTYYWNIVPSDGKCIGIAGDEWHFKVDISLNNIKPQIISIPNLTCLLNSSYLYKVDAIDVDGDILIYQLGSEIPGMSIDAANGTILWTPTKSQIGNHTVIVQVKDGRGGLAEQIFVITVIEPEPPTVPIDIPPLCIIVSPGNNTAVRKTVLINGNSVAGTRSVQLIQIKVGNGTWTNTSGVENWSFAIDTTKYPNGQHEIQARAFDGVLYSAPIKLMLVFDNPAMVENNKSNENANQNVYILVIIGIIVGFISMLLYLKKRRREIKVQ